MLARVLRVGMVVASEYESDARVRRQAEALAGRGDRVTVLALHAPGRPRVEDVDGVRVVHLAVRKYRGDSAREYLRLYGSFALHAAWWIARRPRAFDVVQAHSMPEALVFCALVQRLAGVPVLLDMHDLSSTLFASKFGDTGPLMSTVRLSERASMAFASEVLAVHEPFAELLRGLTGTPVTTVLNCPDDRLFSPRPWRPWDPQGEVVLGYHGLIAPRHGLVTAVEALAEIRNKLPGVRLRVRGSGDGLDELRTRVAELRMADCVELPDALLPVTSMPAFLDGVDIGLVPSRLDAWTRYVLPNKLMEYAYAGIPVVTFRNPVIERYFPEDAVTYVDPASVSNLRDAVIGLIRDPDRAAAQAQRAREVMVGRTWTAQRQHYFDLVDRVGGRARTGH
jgi:glycosyltransferase involved in cell wall biosynthesis